MVDHKLFGYGRAGRPALLAAAVLLALSGCSSTQERAPAAVEDAGGAGTSGANTTGVDQSASFSGDPLDDPSSPLSRRVIYFEFNSAEVAPEDRAIVSAHAEYLASHPQAQVTLEGHADERGTREYNIALGERRALTVRGLMSVLGATPDQLSNVSYGEERPVDEGHTEAAWSQNRRVEIVYRSRG